MALEAEIFVLSHVRLAEVIVLDATSAFNRANCIALTVSEDRNRGCGEL